MFCACICRIIDHSLPYVLWILYVFSPMVLQAYHVISKYTGTISVSSKLLQVAALLL